MTTVKQSFSASLVALFGTVQTTAQTTAQTIEAAASGIDMLNRYVDKAKTEQLARHKVEAKNAITNILHDAAEAQAQREYDLEKRLSKDARLAQLFQSNLKELEQLFAPETSA